MIGAVAVVVGACSAAAVDGTCPTLVGSAAQLKVATACAAPDAEIRLAPGYYGSARIVGRHNPLTIRSEDPAYPAHFRELLLSASTNVTLQDVTFRGSPTGQRHQLLVSKAQRITLNNLHFYGDSTENTATRALGVMIRDSRDVALSDSKFEGFWHGVSLLNVDGLRVISNRFTNIRTDGMRGGGVSNATIAKNVLTDFFPAIGDHPDAIQLWSTHQTIPGRNIEVRDNLIFRGKGRPMQGVFIRDTHQMLPFENVTIKGNLVVGGLYNGITIDGVVGATVSDNAVIPQADRASWLRIERGYSVSLTRNRAGRFIARGGVVLVENQIVAATNNPDAEIAVWAQQHKVVR